MPKTTAPKLPIDYVSAGAQFDPTRTWRYSLWRRWDITPALLWIMLNPSTADETVLDPTLRRCESFSRALGFGAFTVGNLFALRSTDPAGLYRHPDPVGPKNDEALLELARMASKIVCGWGAEPIARERSRKVFAMLPNEKLYSFERNKDGSPKHPLYLSKSSELKRMASWEV